VGASAVAIALGVWPAVLAVSFALLIQALIFGDGGITALGANCLNMAIVESFVAVFVWNLLRPKDFSKQQGRVFWAAFVAGYLGILAAAFTTAIQFGIQPALEKSADGTPMYCPYPLSIALPAMLIPHLVVGVLEGCVTGFLIVAMARSRETSVGSTSNLVPGPALWKRKSFWAVCVVVILLVPAGLWLPRITGAGDAWGEWDPETAAHKANLKTVPAGMGKLAEFWKAPAPDYTFRATENRTYESVQYVFAAVAGVIAIAFVFALLGRWQKARMKALSEGFNDPS